VHINGVQNSAFEGRLHPALSRCHRYCSDMTDETIRQLPRDEVDEELAEEWIRETDEPEVRNVGANKWLDGEWQVSIWAAEFVRQEPLQSRMKSMLTEALQAVAGVTSVWQEDREVWHVTGTPTGSELTGAAAAVVDSLEDDIRAQVNG
jgi:hypothetical protein